MIKREDKIKIEDRILSLMEQNNLAPWKCPWMFKNADYGFKNKSPYRGVNAVMTSLYRSCMGFTSNNWFTKTKIYNLNGYFYNEEKKKFIKDKEGKYDTFYHIKKGAKAIPIVKFNVFKEVDEKTGEPILDENGKEIIKPSPGASFHSVFFRRRHLPLTLRQAIARGGKQMPNSSTSTPLRRAIIKCPNSCPVTSSINIKRPTIIPKIIPITIYNNTPKSLF